MTDESVSEVSEGHALELVKRLQDESIKGLPGLSSPVELANQYMENDKYEGVEAKINALIKWEAGKNFTTGFVTSIGSVWTLPIAIPAALGASWVIQMRMVGAIAHLYGYDLNDDQVRTAMILTLLGNAAENVVKEAGVKVTEKISANALSKVSGKALIEINKKVGFRLITKAGEKGVINLTKAIPLIGGFISGTFDGTFCYEVGYLAKRMFRPPGVEADDHSIKEKLKQAGIIAHDSGQLMAVEMKQLGHKGKEIAGHTAEGAKKVEEKLILASEEGILKGIDAGRKAKEKASHLTEHLHKKENVKDED